MSGVSATRSRNPALVVQDLERMLKIKAVSYKING